MAITGRQRMGTEANAHFQSKFVTFDTDKEVGLFFALDKTDSNKGVLANKTLADQPAVGFIERGSAEGFGEAYADEPNRQLRAGEGQKVYLEGILDLGEITFTDEEVAKRIPIYEGTAGGWTKVKTTTKGERVRVLGFPRDKASIYVNFLIDPIGTVVV